MSVVLLLLFPFGSVTTCLCCPVTVLQGDSPVLPGEQEQPSAPGCERPDLKGKTPVVRNPPSAERHSCAFDFTSKGQLALANTGVS